MGNVYNNATVTYNSVAITEVTSFSVSRDGERITHSADTDSYLTSQAIVKQDRKIEVHTDDLSDAFGLTPSSTAQTLSCVAKGAAGASDLTFSGSFIVESVSGGVQHASLDNDCTIMFAAVSSDGTTDPLSVS